MLFRNTRGSNGQKKRRIGVYNNWLFIISNAGTKSGAFAPSLKITAKLKHYRAIENIVIQSWL